MKSCNEGLSPPSSLINVPQIPQKSKRNGKKYPDSMTQIIRSDKDPSQSEKDREREREREREKDPMKTMNINKRKGGNRHYRSDELKVELFRRKEHVGARVPVEHELSLAVGS